jgi:soluble lytic murein transglycosylase
VRARSRGGDDGAAIERYDALARAHPAQRWGAEAGYLAARLRFARATTTPSPALWTDTIAAYDAYLKGASPSAPGQSHNAREARRERALVLLEAGKPVDARKAALKAADDAGTRARLDLVAAIASERAGDKADAVARLRALIADAPISYVAIAARARLERLGEALPSAPLGPVALEAVAAPSPVTPAWMLLSAGLPREAIDVLRTTSIDASLRARCATFGAFDDAASAYSISIGASGTSAPRAGDAWAFRCAHPTPWASLTDALEKAHHLPHGLLHALLRQESAFRVDVVSGAGAVGVAQLLPVTALMTSAHVPSLAGRPLDVEDLRALEAPALQLSLAAAHLEALYRELLPATTSGVAIAQLLDDDEARARATPLVIAAYNAGAAAVKRWLVEAGSLDADIFLERVPFIETRTYVARVLGNLAAYAVVHGEPLPRLPPKLRVP